MEVPPNVLDKVWDSKPADWRQHENGKGWIYKTAHVDATVYLHPTSIVYGNALVSGNAQVSGDALVSGNALVSGDARVYGDALVSGNALVSGDALVSGKALVYGDARALSPLYIQGTRHAVTLCSHTQIAIGCHVYDIKDWQKHYRAIGKKNGYSKEQIAEYRAYINLCAKTAKQFAKK